MQQQQHPGGYYPPPPVAQPPPPQHHNTYQPMEHSGRHSDFVSSNPACPFIFFLHFSQILTFSDEFATPQWTLTLTTTMIMAVEVAQVEGHLIGVASEVARDSPGTTPRRGDPRTIPGSGKSQSNSSNSLLTTIKSPWPIRTQMLGHWWHRQGPTTTFCHSPPSRNSYKCRG